MFSVNHLASRGIWSCMFGSSRSILHTSQLFSNISFCARILWREPSIFQLLIQHRTSVHFSLCQHSPKCHPNMDGRVDVASALRVEFACSPSAGSSMCSQFILFSKECPYFDTDLIKIISVHRGRTFCSLPPYNRNDNSLLLTISLFCVCFVCFSTEILHKLTLKTS